MKRFIIDIVSSVLLGLGIILLASPLLLYWWIHGSYERYIWIINGPYPYSSFGSGPYQTALGLGLVFIGALLVLVAILLRRKLSR